MHNFAVMQIPVIGLSNSPPVSSLEEKKRDFPIKRKGFNYNLIMANAERKVYGDAPPGS